MWWSSKSGFGARTTAEQVTEGIDASQLTVIITGATSGIGTETARVLALRGAHVYIGGRNVQSATSTKESLLKELPHAKVDILAPLDLNSQASIRKSAESFLALNQPLHLLMSYAKSVWADRGWHRNSVWDQPYRTFPACQPSTGQAKRDSECYRDRKYNSLRAYGLSKIANLYHAEELTRRLQEEGVTNVTINALHPGAILTNLMRNMRGVYMGLFTFCYYATYFVWKTVPQGAATTCYAALHPSLKGVSGKFYNDCNELKASKYNPLADDAEAARKLWDVSLKLTSNSVTLSPVESASVL